MLEIHAADLLPFARIKSLATAAHSTRQLRQFTDSRRLYPGDVDEAEAQRIHELLCWLLETSLQDPVWAEVGTTWTPIPFDPPTVTPWIASIPGAGVLLSAKELGFEGDLDDLATTAQRGLAALEPHIAPTLLDVASRVSEILCFDMKFPHPPDEPEYAGAPRALFMFGNYWDSYRAILDQHGAADVSEQPHPMVRFIASLQYRLREYATRIADEALSTVLEDVLVVEFDSESQPVWEDWAQPQINRLQRAFEEVRVRRGSRRYDLTPAEDLFLQTTAANLVIVSREVDAYRTSALRPPTPAAPPAADRDVFPEPVPGFHHSPDLRTVRLRGETFSLTPQQAQVVQMLLDAYLSGALELSQAHILDRIGSDSGELRNTFRSLKRWRTLIVPGATRGMFRLNL